MEALQRVVRAWIASEQEEDVNTAVSGEPEHYYLHPLSLRHRIRD